MVLFWCTTCTHVFQTGKHQFLQFDQKGLPDGPIFDPKNDQNVYPNLTLKAVDTQKHVVAFWYILTYFHTLVKTTFVQMPVFVDKIRNIPNFHVQKQVKFHHFSRHFEVFLEWFWMTSLVKGISVRLIQAKLKCCQKSDVHHGVKIYIILIKFNPLLEVRTHLNS